LAPPDPPPVPISATWAGGADPIVVTFDKALVDAPGINPAVFGARLNGFGQTIVSGCITTDRLTLFRVNDKATPGFDAVWYSPPPNVLIGVNTLPVAAFNITVT